MARTCLLFVASLIVASLFVGGAVVAAADTDAPRSPHSVAPRPNVIHIMVDDAGVGDFTCYCRDSPLQTPHLDRMAAEGLRFTQAYAGAANCAPSRSALMTGRHLGRAYLRTNAGGVSLRDADVTLPEVLRRAGYATGGFGKWGLGPPGSPGAAERQGFDEFVGYYDQVHAHSHFPDRLYDGGAPLPIPENVDFREPETGLVDDAHRHAHDVIYGRMRSFVQRHAVSGQPFYAWGAWTPPHRKSTLNRSEAEPGGVYAPYAARAEWTEFDKIQAAFVTWVDRQLGDLRAVLDDPNGDGDPVDSVAARTLIIFTSDNGGWENKHAWDRNRETRDGQTIDLRGSKETYYEGGLRVPMVACWPETIEPGTTSDFPVAFYDYLPTFAELAGMAATDFPAGVDGVSLAPTLLGHLRQSMREGLYFEGYAYRANEPPAQIARVGDSKLLKLRDGTVELYDLAADPGETRNLADDPEFADERAALLEFIERQHAPMAAQLAVNPPRVGTSAANRDGVIAHGVRPPSDERAWSLAAPGNDAQAGGPLAGPDQRPMTLYLDDLQADEYVVALAFEPTEEAAVALEVRLTGASGHVYYAGSLNCRDVSPAAPQTMQCTLRPTQLSPPPAGLGKDLGAPLQLSISPRDEHAPVRLLEARVVVAGPLAP